MAGREKTPSETPQTNDNAQLEQLAAMNGAAMGAFAEAYQAYVKGVTLINGELTAFMNTRLRHDANLGQALAACKDWNEVVTLQQGWYQEAATEYQAETARLMEMTTKMARESWTPVTQQVNAAMETGRKPRS